MAVLPFGKSSMPARVQATSGHLAVRAQMHRKQVVNAILLAIVVFQLIDLPGAVLMKSAAAIWTVILGLVLCGVALWFNYKGKSTIVGLLLIAVIDLGCGLMLLATPMGSSNMGTGMGMGMGMGTKMGTGLGLADLPVFDVLIVSELIAVSLLPPKSVFPVALSNIAFIIADIMLQTRASDLQGMLNSNMGYNLVAQPISLQIVVAAVSYIWVRNAISALERADRAEEIAILQQREAELQQREIERQQHLDEGVAHLSQVLVQAANGDRAIRAQMGQDNMLWRVGSSLNLLLIRLGRSGQMEQENKHLRAEVSRLTEAWYVARTLSRAQTKKD